MKHAYTVYINDYSRGLITDDNMVICDESNLIPAINKLLSRESNGQSSVCVKRCELMVNDPDSDKYRMGAWGKTSGE